MCLSKCSFLFNNYTDIFNKIKNDEIDLSILDRFLNVLKQIEDGNVDRADIDKDDNGTSDIIAYDYNQDGEWDKYEEVS